MDAGGVDTCWVADSSSELLAGATDRESLQPDDGKSGSRFERVHIDGEPHFVKSVSRPTDWIMRITGDDTHRTMQIWEAGIMAAAPPEIDHTVVGMAIDGEGPDAPLTILMRDVGPHLIPEGDTKVTDDDHLGFVDALAALSVTFWEWRDTIGLTPMADRIGFFAPDNIADEVTNPPDGTVPGPLRVADEGWRLLPERAPRLAEIAFAVHHDTAALADALAATPRTFLHGDWKMGNLGRYPEGRTILLDWAYPGQGPPCYDLAWYLALNRARLPSSKAATIEAFRRSLARRGVDTEPWFDRQMGLCCLAIMATFAWEKAVGDADELAWWERAALAGGALL